MSVPSDQWETGQPGKCNRCGKPGRRFATTVHSVTDLQPARSLARMGYRCRPRKSGDSRRQPSASAPSQEESFESVEECSPERRIRFRIDTSTSASTAATSEDTESASLAGNRRRGNTSCTMDSATASSTSEESTEGGRMGRKSEESDSTERCSTRSNSTESNSTTDSKSTESNTTDSTAFENWHKEICTSYRWPHCCEDHWEKYYRQSLFVREAGGRDGYVEGCGAPTLPEKAVLRSNAQLPHISPEGIFDRCIDCRELCPLQSTATAGYNKNCDFDYGPYYAEQAARGTCQIQYWDGHYYIPYKNYSVWWKDIPTYGCFQPIDPNLICYDDKTGDIITPCNADPKAYQHCPTTNLNKCCVPRASVFLPFMRCCRSKCDRGDCGLDGCRPPGKDCCGYAAKFDNPSRSCAKQPLLDDAPYDYYYGLDSFTDFVPNAVHRYSRVQDNGLVTD